MQKCFSKILCPQCGRMLGCYEENTAVIRKKGRVVRIVSWQDAWITCEDCGASVSIEPPGRDGQSWDGVLKSLKSEIADGNERNDTH